MLKCFVCGEKGKYIFCEKHNPKYGDCVIARNKILFVGSIPFFKAIKYWARGKNIIKWWVGTDALEMRMTPPGKNKIKRLLHVIKMRLLNIVITEHWIINKCLIRDYPKLENKKIVLWPPDKFTKIKKKKHNNFIVGYYFPADTKFNRWKYGIDIIKKLKIEFPNIIFLRLFREIPDISFRIMDCYIRPSRHDGMPRINLRCEIEGIPYKYSSDFKPEFEDFKKWINEKYEVNKMDTNK